MQIEVPADQVSREYDEVSRKFQRNATLPGFRKGKVPRSLVEKSFGDRIQEEVVKRLLEEAYRSALRETNLQPVSYPQIDKIDFKVGEPMAIEAVVEVKPEIEFVDYKKVAITRPKIEVSDEDVEKALDSVQERYARYTAVEDREAQPTDMVVMDQVARDESGLKIPKGSGTDLSVPVGHEQTRPEFDQALRGVRVGDERQVVVEFPEDESDPAFAGKRVTFDLKIKEVKLKELPDLDDEFAQQLGDFENLDALREVIRTDLERQAAQRTEQSMRAQLMRTLIERNPFDLPESMVEHYLDNIVEAASAEAQKDPRRAATFDPEAVREQNRTAAEQLIRQHLLFEAIQKAEEIVVDDEEVDARIAGVAEANNLPARKMRISLEKEGKLSRIHDDLLEEKTFKVLFDLAEVTEES
jgi:trigger factor